MNEPGIELELVHVAEDEGVITLDFIVADELTVDGDRAIPAGQPFALDFLASDGDGTTAATAKLRSWADEPQLVRAGSAVWGDVGPVLVLARAGEAVLLRFR